MGLSEYYFLISSLEGVYNKTFNCHVCKKQYGSDDFAVKKTQKVREVKGCFDIAEKHRYELKCFKYYNCIGNHYHPSISFWINLFNNLEKGILPYEGSYADQPCKIIEIFDIIEGVKLDKQEKEKRQRKLNEKSGGRRWRAPGNKG